MSTSKRALKKYEDGLKRFQSGELEKAIEAFAEAIALAPEFAEAYSDRGGVYSLLRRDKKAEKDLKKAISLKPSLAAAHYNLGATLGRQGKFLESIPYLDAASRLGLDKAKSLALQARRDLFVQAQEDSTMENAIEAFLDTTSPNELEAKVTEKYPFMILPEFMEPVADNLRAVLPTHEQPMLEERLEVLRRMANRLMR